MMSFLKWRPIKLYEVNADTGKPVESNKGTEGREKYFELRTDSKGNKQIVAHRGGTKAAVAGDEKKAGDDKAKARKDEAAAKTANGDEDQDQWTAEEDKQLIHMKENTTQTWAEMGKILGGRSKGAVAERYKKLKKDAAPANNDANQDQKKAEASGGKADEKKGKQKHNQNNQGGKGKNKQDKGKANVQQKQEAKAQNDKAPSKAGSKANGEAKFTMNEWQTLQEDDMFSFGELQCLSELIVKDNKQSWLRIASQFYDLTGRRVHPDDIRDKFHQMGSML